MIYGRKIPTYMGLGLCIGVTAPNVLAKEMPCVELADQFMTHYGLGTFYRPDARVNTGKAGDDGGSFSTETKKDPGKGTSISIGKDTYNAKFPTGSAVFQTIASVDFLKCQMTFFQCVSGDSEPSIKVSSDDCHAYYADRNSGRTFLFTSSMREPASPTSGCAKEVQAFCERYEKSMSPPLAPVHPIGTARPESRSSPRGNPLKSGVGN